jgi:hypothetical protein
MNIMGNVQAPTQQTRQSFEGEEFINLCKALNVVVQSIAQISELQLNLHQQIQKNKATSPTGESQLKNSARIILFTSAKIRNLEQLQEFASKAIQECNNNIDLTLKNDKM